VIEYKGKKVPEILLSGDHQKIAKWRIAQAIEKTKLKRPDLLINKEKNGSDI
jgi:tRNA (guanine37-N1)-methyltransferase